MDTIESSLRTLKANRQKWIYFALSISISALVLLPTLWYAFGPDHGMGAYAAWIWRRFGQLPYVNYFEGDFPGIFLIYYFIQTVLGESVTGFRAFDLIWQTATIAFLYLITERAFRKPMAGLIASLLYAIFYLGLGFWNTGERDGFLLLPCAAAFWLYFRRARRAAVRVCLSGQARGRAPGTDLRRHITEIFPRQNPFAPDLCLFRRAALPILPGLVLADGTPCKND